MSFRRSAWLFAGFVCACERAPTRLERVSQQIEQKAEDEDLVRGRAALEKLAPKTIAPPPARARAEHVKLTFEVSAADGELDASAVEAIAARLAALRLPGRIDWRGTALAVTIEEAPRERENMITAAIAAQGRLNVAYLGSARRGREELRFADPALRWTPLPVVRIEPSETDRLSALTLALAPEGEAALAQATGQGGYMALAFDDLVLMVPRVDGQVTGGKLTLMDHAAELGDPRGSVTVLAVALTVPAPEPWSVRAGETESVGTCGDWVDCEAACERGSGRACVQVAEGRTEPAAQVEALKAACSVGGNEGCTKLCRRGDRESCMAAIATLHDATSAWSDARHAGALEIELCRKGDLDFCTPGLSALIFGALGPGEFVTADAILKEIRDEALLVQTTALRRYYLDQARAMCREIEDPAIGAGACLFVAHAHAGGVLAGRDPAAEEEALRRAGTFLREAGR